jgi:hypothetical protein
VLETTVDLLRAALRQAVTHEPPTDPDFHAASAAWSQDPEACAEALRSTLDALDAVDRNANLTVLIDAWTAILEEPRLARLA